MYNSKTSLGRVSDASFGKVLCILKLNKKLQDFESNYDNIKNLIFEVYTSTVWMDAIYSNIYNSLKFANHNCCILKVFEKSRHTKETLCGYHYTWTFCWRNLYLKCHNILTSIFWNLVPSSIGGSILKTQFNLRKVRQM